MNLSIWGDALGTVWSSTIGSLISYFPVALSSILVAVFGILLGSWVRDLIVKGLHLVKFEGLVKDTKFQAFLHKAEISHKLEDIVAGMAKWLIVLTFFIAATNIAGLTSVSSVLSGVLRYIPNVVSAVIVLALGVLLAGVVESVVKGALSSIDLKTGRLMGKVASYTVVTIAILAAFSELKIADSFINILFIGFVAMISLGFGLAIGLGAKDLIGLILTDWYKQIQKDLKK